MDNPLKNTFIWIALIPLLYIWGMACPAQASPEYGSKAPHQKAMASLSSPRGRQIGKVFYFPMRLRNGSTLTFISPSIWNPLRERLEKSLKTNHQNLEKLFGEIPPFTTSIRLMDEEAFFLKTGAPRWTNAMYYRNEITIPLSLSKPLEYTSIVRAVKHEHTHAIIHSLSGAKCPGWLDEGLAQWAEGQENPALRPALLKWLKKNKPVPFSLLQGGFTRLQTRMVPAAYAQSLFATNTLINTYGFKVIYRFLNKLKKGQSSADAFVKSFRMSEQTFEKKLFTTLNIWARKTAVRR